MPVEQEDTFEEREERIFELLRGHATQCAVEISAELSEPLDVVESTLLALERDRVIERRWDRGMSPDVDKTLIPWGLSRSL